MIALTLGVIATSWQAVVATRASKRATTAEARASRHLQGALDAVDQMLSRVGDKKLENIPLMEEVRYELLEDAVRLYDRFLQDAPQDPQLQTETAVTERRKARVLLQLDRRDEAREPIERSIRLLREQLNAAPDSEPLRLELARSLLLAGPILQQLPPLEEAVAMLRQVDSRSESHRDAMMELGFALSKIALESEKLGDPGRCPGDVCRGGASVRGNSSALPGRSRTPPRLRETPHELWRVAATPRRLESPRREC